MRALIKFIAKDALMTLWHSKVTEYQLYNKLSPGLNKTVDATKENLNSTRCKFTLVFAQMFVNFI